MLRSSPSNLSILNTPSVTSKPTVSELDLNLTDLVEWQIFAIHLPNITNTDIRQIEHDTRKLAQQKLDLFGTWLRRRPTASWRDVTKALEKAKENALANAITKKFDVVNSSAFTQHISDITDASDQVQPFSSNQKVSLPSEEIIIEELKKLHRSFTSLAKDIRCKLEELVKSGKSSFHDIAAYIEEAQVGIRGLTKLNTTDELFEVIRPHNDYLDCELLEMIVEEYLHDDDITQQVKAHIDKVKLFKCTTPIKTLRNKLQQYASILNISDEHLVVTIKLQNDWGRVVLKYIEKLVQNLLQYQRKVILKVEAGSISIMILVPKEKLQYFIDASRQKLQFMRLMGIFMLQIGDITVLQESENKKFTLDSALLESSQSGNNEAVQFLLDLGVNINYSNSEGKTALMLASEAGHEEVVQILVSAGANVNLQDSTGQTALMFANGNVGIACCLLLANTDSDLQQEDGNTALHIACYKRQSAIGGLLLCFGATFVIPNTKGDTAFLASVRGNNTEILKLMLNSIPYSPFIVSLGVVYACRFGHSAVFNLFANQLEYTTQTANFLTSCAEGDVGSVVQHIMEFNIDPNTTLISGITPLMIASSFGNADVLDCLLKAEADVNSTDQDGRSPLTYAITGNTSLHIVQCLLEAGANPNILVGGVTIVESAKEKGEQTICDLLLKYSALHLYKRFTHLVDRIQEGIDTLIKGGKGILLQITQQLEANFHLTGLASKVQTSIDLFNQLTPYYDFLHFEMLVMIVREFLKGDIENELEEYQVMATKFEELVEIQKFKNVLSLVPQQEVTTCSKLTFQLRKQWGNLTLKSLRRLYSYLFSNNQMYPSHMTVDVIKEVPYINFLIPKSTQIIEAFTSEEANKKETMYFLGVIIITINNVRVLANENTSFTFDSALLESSQSGNNEAVQFLLDLGVNINYSNSEGRTALMLASKAGHEEVVQILVSVGANINLQDNTGRTALMVSKTKEIFSLLLQSNADINIFTHRGSTPLIVASDLGHLSVVEMLLIAHRFDPNFQNEKGWTALLYASLRGHYQVVQILLENFGDPNLQGENGLTALMLASFRGDYQVVEILLKKGADPNIYNNNGYTTLIVACQNGHQQVVELLLEKEVDPNVQNSKNGRTPLVQASENGHYQVVEILLKKGADSNIHDNDGWTALFLASLRGHYQVVEILLKNGADPNIHGNDGWTALLVASENGHQQIVELLLEKQVDPNVQNSKNGRTALIQNQFLLDLGVNINYSNSEGKTALMLASEAEHEEIVRTLVSGGANVNRQDSAGETALMLSSGNVGIIHCLLLANANLDIQRKDGNTALHIACYKGHNTVMELLLSYHASPVIKNAKNDTPFMASVRGNNSKILKLMLDAIPSSPLSSGVVLACRLGHSAVFSLLVKQLECTPQVIDLFISCAEGDMGSVIQHIMEFNIDPNTTLISGITPLMIASSCGHVEVIDTLIQAEADVNRIDTDNYSPLAYAITGKKSFPSVEFLLEAGANPHALLGGITILEIAYGEEGQQDICDILLKFSALDLQKQFTHLLDRIEEGFDVLISKKKDILLHISQFLEVYPEITGSSKVHNSTDLFSRVRAYSDFLSYDMLVALTRKFLQDDVNVQKELKEYVIMTRRFDDLLKIEHFQNVMAFLPQQEETAKATTTYLVFKLNRLWCYETLKNVRSLCSFLFSDNRRYLSHMTVDIVEKVPCIKFLIPNSKQVVEDLISEALKKRELTYLLGVFEMMINNIPVLMKAEDKIFTFLQMSAQFGNYNVRYSNGIETLMRASELGNFQVVKTLLEEGAVPNIHDKNVSTALIVASQNGHQQVVELLLEKQVDPNAHLQENGRTALIQASQQGHYQVVEVLLKKGADPNIHDNDGGTALLLCSQNGHQQIVELLLEKQVDPNVQTSKNGRTALIQASQQGHYQVVEVLLKKGADPNILNNNGLTALFIASLAGHYQVVELLLKNGAEPNIHNNDGRTALLLSGANGHYQVVEILLKNGADPNIYDNNGRTALLVSSAKGHYQVVKILLKNGADHNILDNNGLTALFIASVAGHYQVVEILLNNGADPNIHDNDGQTALSVSGENGHYQVVEILLNNGADPNIHDNDGWTALISASQNGHQQVVELLLEKQVDPNVQNSKNGVTALISASQQGHYKVVEILLKSGADPNIHNIQGASALLFASLKNHYQVVEILLKNGADPNILGEYGATVLLREKQVDTVIQNSTDPHIYGSDKVTALLSASQSGDYQLAEILLENGVDPNIHDNEGWTALIVSSQNGHQQIVELLLEKQVDPNAQLQENGRTALIQASQQGHYQVVEVLLKKGADPNILDNNGLTALFIASVAGHYQVVEILLENGADPNIHDNDGRTALLLSSANGRYPVIEILLKKGADPNIRDNDGWTALISASQNGHQQVVELLLEKQVDPNVQNSKNGRTALIQASQQGHYQVVEVLLKKCADPNILDNYGLTALFIASVAGHYQVVEILLKNGADPNIHDNDGQTALLLSSANGHYPVIKILLENGADPNIRDNDGWTALISASQNGHQQVVELLLEKQVDPNVQNSKNGRTALIQASQQGHYQVVEVLLKKGADLNIFDNNRSTALFIACVASHYQVVEILLKKGADPNILSNNEHTALIVASMKGHSHIIEVLLRYNANPHYLVTIDGLPIDSLALAISSGNIECLNIFLKHTELSLKSLSMGLYLACGFGHAPVIRLLSNRLDIVSDQRDLIIACAEGDLGSVVDQLMSGKISPDVEFVHGVTPLMISSSFEHTDIVKALITAGANVNKTDEFGRTALDYTEVSEQDATRNILLQHGGIKGPDAESESHDTTSEEQKLSTDTSQSTMKGSLLIRKKELKPKKTPFLSIKKLFKDTVKYIFSPLQHFDIREYSTTTHIPIF